MHQNGPWKIIQSREVYQNEFLTLQEDAVIQPDGKEGTYATIKMLPGIAVLPIDEEGNVYLVQLFRYSLGKESIEAIAGAIEDLETPLEAAQRELKEEAGILSQTWLSLGYFDVDTSIIKCPMSLFTARDITFSKPEREGTETMKLLKLPFQSAIDMIFKNEITHSATCVLLLKAYHLT
jgi:ADP-ribose pyrophosphatase